MNTYTRVWITGAKGLIGYRLCQTAPEMSRVIALTRENLDLTDFAAVERQFAQDRPDLIIHCAAMSRSPECTDNVLGAFRINHKATVFLAQLARDVNFIFFSTDQVFDGAKGSYVESDSPNPLGIYGATKLAAEKDIAKNPRHTIIRLALCGGCSLRKTAFNEELHKVWSEQGVPKFFMDEYRTPIAAPVAARAVWELAASGATGIYHLGGSKRMSRLEIGKLVAARHPELDPHFLAGSLRDYHGAPRAPDTSLCCDKIQKLLSFPLPGLDDWLRDNPLEPF